MIDLEFRSNQLILNPRLPRADAKRFENAWAMLVEPKFSQVVGVATSGSSGDRIGRLIILSKNSLEASARAVNERFASGPGDIWFKSLPSFHVGGLGILIRARLSGASVYDDTSEKWNVRDFYDQLVQSRATLVSLVSTQVFDLVQATLRAPATVRAVIVGGGRFEESLRLRALDLGWPCLPSYGMTETCSQIATALSSDDPRLILLSHSEARTSDDGHLEIKSPSLLSAQIDFSPDAQLIDPKVDGWFTASDRGFVDRRTLTIEGRSSDFVKIGGEGVILARLEERLDRLKLAQGFARDAVVLAAHDERLGAVIVLITDAVDATDAAPTQKLIDEFNPGVLPFERIRIVKQVLSLPRSPLGKLLRAAALTAVGLRLP